jgi:hypothetical protein
MANAHNLGCLLPVAEAENLYVASTKILTTGYQVRPTGKKGQRRLGRVAQRGRGTVYEDAKGMLHSSISSS